MKKQTDIPSRHRRATTFAAGTIACLSAASCGGAGTGTAQVFVEGETTITEGLVAGGEPEDIRDGWNVSYDKFIVTLGNVQVGRSADPTAKLSDPTLHVIDMRALPPSGLLLANFKGVEATRWDNVGYDQGTASTTAMKAPGLSQPDFDMMVAGGFSLYVSGALTKAGQATVSFAWGLLAGVSWSQCGPELGDRGFAVPGGGTTQVKATIHGDHWFFNNFPEGGETTDRRAQWIADVDAMTGGDHLVTTADLAMVAASAVFPAPTYSLQNRLNEVIDNALDFVTTQARTIGHLQGEGECGIASPL